MQAVSLRHEKNQAPRHSLAFVVTLLIAAHSACGGRSDSPGDVDLALSTARDMGRPAGAAGVEHC